jgi:hypothetical protein
MNEALFALLKNDPKKFAARLDPHLQYVLYPLGRRPRGADIVRRANLVPDLPQAAGRAGNELELKARLLKGNNGNGKSLFPDQAARYRWSNWRFKSGKELRDFLRDEVFPYMASLLKEEPQVAIYFQDARMEIDDAHVLEGGH